MLATLTRQPLGQLLLTRGMVVQEHLDRALEEQTRCNHEKLLGEILVELRACTEDQVTQALAEAYGLPYARVGPRVADPKVIDILPTQFTEKHSVLPLFLVENTLTVAIPEPANVFLIDEIQRLAARPVQIVVATAHDIRATLHAYRSGESAAPPAVEAVVQDVTPSGFAVVEKPAEDPAHLEKATRSAPVIKLVNYCIYNALKDGATDIHIEPGDNVLRIRYRIDGQLVEKFRPPFQMQAAVTSRIKLLAKLDITHRDRPQQGEIHVMLDGKLIELRVGAMPGRWGEKVLIRIVNPENVMASLEKLGFAYDTLKQWRKLLALSSGLLLVTGPAGSGKRSTLYAALQELNRPDVNICTIEDPVVYALSGINQFQINAPAGFTFPEALRSLLHQRADIVMASQIADPETARACTQAALTDHLLLATLHAADAPSSVTRLMNLGVEPYLVGASLAGVLAQRLVRKLCAACKQSSAPTLTEKRHLEKFGGSVETLFRPIGCPACHKTGFRGRIGIHELLIIEETLAERISHGAPLREIRELASGLGMRTLRSDGVDKVKAGITTLEEVYRVTA